MFHRSWTVDHAEFDSVLEQSGDRDDAKDYPDLEVRAEVLGIALPKRQQEKLLVVVVGSSMTKLARPEAQALVEWLVDIGLARVQHLKEPEALAG